MVSFFSHLRRLQRRRLLASVSPGLPLPMGKQKRLKVGSSGEKSSRSKGGSSPSSSASFSSSAAPPPPDLAATVSEAVVALAPSSAPPPSPPVVLVSPLAVETLDQVVVSPAITSVSAAVPPLLDEMTPLASDLSTPTALPAPVPVVAANPESLPKTPALPAPVPVVAANPEGLVKTPAPVEDRWCDVFKGTSKRLERKGTAFTLPSGESCVKIPNSVIEKHKKSWESFILGQFYSEPPAQGTIHTIVNGIWSKQYRDVTVSKMEGNAFLFRIPNVQTRSRVLNQRLWQIDGQTMFVAKWEPGVTPIKPELTSAPIWLELRGVPFQFFNDDGLEHIASLVGNPKFLHPNTANKTNLEVAKVFTIIDPRKPLPEAVNVQFDSGDVRRIEVSSPWMPPVCAHCKEVGHSLRRCRAAPIKCKGCNSTVHSAEECPRGKPKQQSAAKQRRRRSKTPKPSTKEGEWVVVGSSKQAVSVGKSVPPGPKQATVGAEASSSKPNGENGESGPLHTQGKDLVLRGKGKAVQAAKSTSVSEEDDDSSDLPSSQSEDDYADLEDEVRFTEVLTQRQQRSARGKGPKSH